MLVCNHSTLTFATKVTSRTPPTPEMVLIIKGVYDLVAGELTQRITPERRPPTGDVFRDEDEDRVGGCVYPSDFADHKPRAEFTLRGTCHAPFGRATAQCDVAVTIGALTKKLRVMGPRVWVDDPAGSHPDARRACPHVANQHRRRRAADAGHVVVLGEPEPPVAQALCVLRQLQRMAEGQGGRAPLDDRREIEDGKRNHGLQNTRSSERRSRRSASA